MFRPNFRGLWSLTLLVGCLTLVLVAPATAKRAPTPTRWLELGRGLETRTHLWVWPLEQNTSMRAFLKPNSDWGAGHRGIDLEATPGEQISAPTDGRLAFAGLAFGVPTVVIRQDPISTVLQPACAAEALEVSEVLQVGDNIGTVCSTTSSHHCASGYCLHWSIKFEDDYLNPLFKLEELVPAQLLPVDQA